MLDFLVLGRIGHFPVTFRFCIKTSLNAKPFNENEFRLQVLFHANEIQCHMKGLRGDSF